MESLFSGMYHPVQVTAVEDLANALRKVRFEGDFSKSKKAFVPGNVIEFRINDTEFRHYTPSLFDTEQGVCDVLFYLHDKGPGSKWVAKLKTGDELKLLGPGGKIKYNAQSSFHIAFGDETSLGSFVCIDSEAKKQGHVFWGIAELEEENISWPRLLNLDVGTVSKNQQWKADGAIGELGDWLQQHHAHKDSATFYLTGNAKSILSVKKLLLASGLKNNQIQTEPYWVEGKQGL